MVICWPLTIKLSDDIDDGKEEEFTNLLEMSFILSLLLRIFELS